MVRQRYRKDPETTLVIGKLADNLEILYRNTQSRKPYHSLTQELEVVQRKRAFATAEVLFLDIKLIGGDAFQLLNHLNAQKTPIPPVVINTGFREFEYAQKLHNEFGNEIIFILKKPFWEAWEQHQERIIEALYARNQAERLAGSTWNSKRLTSIQNGARLHLVNLDDVIVVKTGPKGQGKSELTFEHHKLNCNIPLIKLLTKLPPDFIQINRFEVINTAWISFVDKQNRELRLRNGIVCSLGYPFYAHLMGMLGELRSFARNGLPGAPNR